MKSLRGVDSEYWRILAARASIAKVHKQHQLVGLNLATILQDEQHKSLYMRLAKTHDHDMLLALAKQVAERGAVTRKGAYFMKILERMGKQATGKTKTPNARSS